MRPTRRTQPYRRNTGRQPGLALMAMKRGRDAFGRNPADVKRATMRKKRRGIARLASR